MNLYIDSLCLHDLIRLGLLDDFLAEQRTLGELTIYALEVSAKPDLRREVQPGALAEALLRHGIRWTSPEQHSPAPGDLVAAYDPHLVEQYRRKGCVMTTRQEIQDRLGMPEGSSVQRVNLLDTPDLLAALYGEAGKFPMHLSPEHIAAMNLTHLYAVLSDRDLALGTGREYVYRQGEDGSYTLVGRRNLKPKSGKEFQTRNVLQQVVVDAITRPGAAPMTVVEGPVGSGKTLLALMGALQLVEDQSSPISHIYITRPPIGIDARYEVGFLPGGIEEKLNPWVGGIISNLAYVFGENAEKVFERNFTHFPVNMAQGYSIHNAVVIVDEAQLLSRNLLRQLATRISLGSRLILMCDPEQNYGVVPRNDMGILHLKRKMPNELVTWVTLEEIQRSDLTKVFARF
jgi:hypothetical protein